jgi:(1->4)-alpha-D-glucan 1-alpha-D-glucosylmutase
VHIPCSTYRIQLNKEFGFSRSADIIKYLSGLGISDFYASPIFMARKGSMHGYDVVDPTKINSELGSEDDYLRLIEEIKLNKMGWLQDIVPNHMAFHSQNVMLVDLLENGDKSRYYDYFDIEWALPYERLKGRILAPFLGKFYKDALESGELQIKFDEEGFSVNYWDNCFPLRIDSYADILSFNLSKLTNRYGQNDPVILKYLGSLYVTKALATAEDMDERYSQIKFVKTTLWELYNEYETIKVFLQENLKIINGYKENPESFNFLHKILSEQYFRLAFWKVANEEINYRRFFNVNDLISLRMENEETFSRTHSLIFKMIKEDLIQGVRIDHVDGLYHPKAYLQRLRETQKNIYIVVEKILEMEEELPEEWQINGTSGYEFLNFVNGLFCYPGNEKQFTKLYASFAKLNKEYEQIVFDMKRMIIKSRMAGEVERLALLIESISGKDRAGIDFTLHGLKQAMEEILTYFPIYRTYIADNNISERDKKYIREVLARVKGETKFLHNEFDYILQLLTLQNIENQDEEQLAKTMDFAQRFQQLTGPIMAKGFEDTTLYIYNRLISLNEVGGDPGKFGITTEEFHHFSMEKLKKWPSGMNTTSTHDTKRGEDVRARINILSEIPIEWEEKINLWSKLNKDKKIKHGGNYYPSKNDEYLLYQTIVGSHPFVEENREDFIKRVQDYLIKAARESKMVTNWVMPNQDYEKSLTEFTASILNEENEEFLESFHNFRKKIAFYGTFNSLSQLLIKITTPGVPDFYQGTELWDFSLVDPDNRRPVDYELRNRMLTEIKGIKEEGLKDYINNAIQLPGDGKIKIYVMYKALQFRNKNYSLFLEGDYVPLRTEGKHKERIVAFARELEGDWCITIAPRFLTGIINENELPVGEKWEDTVVILPENIEGLKNLFTGERINERDKLYLKNVFSDFPLALLINK